MSIIGVFKKTDDGYEGTIVTLALNAKAKFVPCEKRSQNSPDFRVVTGKGEVGAAWQQAMEEGERPYLSVSLDDPSFGEPVKAALFEADDKSFNLVWNRQKKG
jgi:uncharacterized protein (DUF736 family)